MTEKLIGFGRGWVWLGFYGILEGLTLNYANYMTKITIASVNTYQILINSNPSSKNHLFCKKSFRKSNLKGFRLLLAVICIKYQTY
jgi:hypothetical protein